MAKWFLGNKLRKTLESNILFRLLTKAEEFNIPTLIIWGKSEIDVPISPSILPNSQNITIFDLSAEFGVEKSMSQPAEWISEILNKNLSYFGIDT